MTLYHLLFFKLFQSNPILYNFLAFSTPILAIYTRFWSFNQKTTNCLNSSPLDRQSRKNHSMGFHKVFSDRSSFHPFICDTQLELCVSPKSGSISESPWFMDGLSLGGEATWCYWWALAHTDPVIKHPLLALPCAEGCQDGFRFRGVTILCPP